MSKQEKANSLINETSPYLLQHAYNPVNWFTWGDEAFEKAKAENKPVLVSIGYAACHWCHVMEKESFENDDTAAFMNNHFINIKVDREERPDVDHIYMDAIQAITGSGGWPLNVFLTPDKKPFYGGTYFPPKAAFNRPSWMDVLTGVSNAYTTKKEEIISQAENLTAHLSKANAFSSQPNIANKIFEQKDIDDAFINIIKNADKENGGFGGAPKFPQFGTIQFLLRYHYVTGNKQALQQAKVSLTKMIDGGIYDHVGGGIARYATDNKWLVPHFEKMLYDNALLIITLSEAYQITKDNRYVEAIHKTMLFIEREMQTNEGGFCAALDADSEGKEGKFYTWSYNEIKEIAGKNADLFTKFYDISESGNWEETNILNRLFPLNTFAHQNNIHEDELQTILNTVLNKLLLHRNNRIRPQLDDKVLLGWNALMNTACSKAFAATGYAKYKEMAVTNMHFLLTKFKNSENENKFYHTYKQGKAKYPAFLDDMAFLIYALIHLQEVTGETAYLEKAKNILSYTEKEFIDNKTGFFFFTNMAQDDVLVRKKEVYDGATPSGNSIMAFNMQYLGVVYDMQKWKNLAKQITFSLASASVKYGTSFSTSLINLLGYIYDYAELVIIANEIEDLRNKILHIFIPYKVFQSATLSNNNFPLLAGKNPTHEPQIFLCKNYTCHQPVNSINLLAKQLKNR
jgi:uncharacterized protein